MLCAKKDIHMSQLSLFSARNGRPSNLMLLSLRLCDLVIVIPLGILFAVPMLIITMAIWLEDRDGVLFIQMRVGQGTRKFKMYKFRTMHADRSRIMGDEFMAAPSKEDRAQFKTTEIDDQRITKVGRLLRPTHMDELPQLINVLLGQMSLVGVRPDVPVQQADYTSEVWIERHELKPGITGLAQVDSTIDDTEKRTAQDIYWVRNASISLYFKTIVMTVSKVLKRNSL